MEGAEISLQWTGGSIRVDWYDECDNLAGRLKCIRLPDTALTLYISKVVGDVKIWKHVRDHQLTYIRATHMVRVRIL